MLTLLCAINIWCSALVWPTETLTIFLTVVTLDLVNSKIVDADETLEYEDSNLAEFSEPSGTTDSLNL